MGNNDLNDIPDIEVLKQICDEATRIIILSLPPLQQLTAELIDLVFCPKTVAKQLALAIAIDLGMVTLHQVSNVVQSIASRFSSHSRLIRQLKAEQNQVKTQDEWMELAERIDNIQGNDIWRSDPSCPLYECERISARIDELVHLMRRRDAFDLLFELRGGISRNKFGLLHEGLFSKAMAGSKVLVETYHNVVCAALDFACDSPPLSGTIGCETTSSPPMPTNTKLAFFNEMRHAYGRTALILSGGAALGFYHGGVIKTLIANNLMPRVIGGSSAGSIMCAMYATRTNDEWLNDALNLKGTVTPGHSGQLRIDIFRPFSSTDNDEHYHNNKTNSVIDEVYHNTAGAFRDAKRTWQGVFVPIGLRRMTSAIYDILTGQLRPRDVFLKDTNHFRECVKANVGNFTFQEAFDRTGKILNIVVTPTNATEPPRLLNYLTAPHVLVWSAAVASSSLPGVFEANRLLVREADGTERYECASGQKFNDGSLEQDLPMDQMSEMFNVNHFIISQANPHAVMFGSYNQTKSVWTNPIIGMIDATLLYLKEILRNWFHSVINFVSIRRITPMFGTRRDTWANLITQEYEGRDCDISLIPWHSHRSLFSAFLHCVYNPSKEELLEWVEAAERETFKYLPAIKSHIAEEITLDLCVQRLRKRLITEQVDKRRLLAAVAASTDEKMMGERLPSFFTSPSLSKLNGMGTWDELTNEVPVSQNDAENEALHSGKIGELHAPVSTIQVQTTAEEGESKTAKAAPTSTALGSLTSLLTSSTTTRHLITNPTKAATTIARVPNHTYFPIHSGWAGLGLRGNRSSGSLRGKNSRPSSSGSLESCFPSTPSGLFVDGDDQQQQRRSQQECQQQQQIQQQVPGEDAIAVTL